MAGIYIHIPFCRRICHYCDFYRTAGRVDAGSYTDALEKEMALRAGYLRGERIETLYFGGGTPSVLDVAALRQIMDLVSRYHTLSSGCEITLEANPDDLSEDYLRALCSDTSVNRLSIGIQSFRNRDLVLMNRRHTAEEACLSVERAKKHGFSNISVDLIYGIPDASQVDLAFSLGRLAELDVQHVSAYHLTIEPGTVFYRKAEKGLMLPVSEEESLSQYLMVTNFMEQHDFVHYEVSNWGKEGYFSRHNTAYWQGKPYLGLGPSAHSFDTVSRQWNVANLAGYLQALKDGTPFCEREMLTGTMRYNELLLTSLRTMWGLSQEMVADTFGAARRDALLKECDRYIRSGHMIRAGDRVKLTETGYFISDAIIRDLMDEEGQL